MKKSLFCFLFFIYLSLTSPVFANKCGVNIGPNYSQVNQVKNLTKEGGWIVTLGFSGDCSNFESLFGKGLNVVIRAYNGNQKFTNTEALAWIATLGTMDSKGQAIYFMPWNEPNHDNECGGNPCSPQEVINYVNFLKNELEKAGLLNTKVILLSPMIDKLNPRFEEFKNIYNLTNGSSINEYDQFSPGPCSPNVPPQMNNCKYDQIGIPPPYYALESGVAGTCLPPCYHDNELIEMLNTVWPKWSNDGNFKMFAIFSYDPHRPGEWDIFNSSRVRNFYSANCQPGGVSPGNFNKDTFEAWLKPYLENGTLIQCENSCGYAPADKPELCTGVESSPGSSTPFTPITCKPIGGEEPGVECGGPPISFNAKIYYTPNDPACIRKKYSGEIRISNLDIPFVEHLNDYFTGTLDYEHLSPSNLLPSQLTSDEIEKRAGVLAKLAPVNLQDELKLEFLREIQERISKGMPTRYKNFTIGGLTPEEIIERFLPIREKRRLNQPLTPEEKEFLKNIWSQVPMFANEEAKGIITFYGDGASGWVDTGIPEVYKLSKVTSLLQNMLIGKKEEERNTSPTSRQTTNLSSAFSEFSNSRKNTPSLVTAKKKNSFLSYFKSLIPKVLAFVNLKSENQEGKKVLLAQACRNCVQPGISNVRVEGSYIRYSLTACQTCPESTGYVGDVYMGPCGNLSQVHSIPPLPECFSSDHPAIAPPIPAKCPGNHTVCVGIRANRDVDESCKGIEIYYSCQVELDSNCQIVKTTCGGYEGPAPGDTCPETPENPENPCKNEALPGPPQTPACSELETQDYPNLFGQIQFKNDLLSAPTPTYTPTAPTVTPAPTITPTPTPPLVSEAYKEKTISLNINNTVPYLIRIAKNTVDLTPPGLFRLFVPKLKKEEDSSQKIIEKTFEYLPGEDSQVNYSLKITQKDPELTISPSTQNGILRLLFYKLGTIFNVKNLVSQEILLPL